LNNAKFRIQELDRRTLSWWKTRRDRIDMDPPYQRKGRRWAKSDKQYLIDSILNGFDVPKFYLSDFTWGPSELNRNASAYAVIDGKQRFEAIFDFFDGKIAISDEFKYIADPNVRAAGLTLEHLRAQYPAIAEEFENFNPIIMGVVTSDRRFIEELFVRLNRSRPLTGAEVRNAMPGPIPEIVRQICSHYFFTSNSKFPIGSGQDLNLAAKILMLEKLGEFDNTKKENLDKFTSAASNADNTSFSSTIDQVLKNLDSMTEVFLFEDNLLANEGPIPVYYWLVRSLPGDQHWNIRDFLATFAGWLKTPEKASHFPPELVLDLEIYATALRSVNDKSSHEKRYALLKRWFDKWSDGVHR
jgi:Protein of unknown function DUF262